MKASQQAQHVKLSKKTKCKQKRRARERSASCTAFKENKKLTPFASKHQAVKLKKRIKQLESKLNDLQSTVPGDTKQDDAVLLLSKRMDAYDKTVAANKAVTTVAPLVEDNTESQHLLHRVLALETAACSFDRFTNLQNKRNDININLFVTILNELSLKLNMKGRMKDTKGEDAPLIKTQMLCSMKNCTNEDYLDEERKIAEISGNVLEATAISLSGQTVTSIDDKNLHRVRQIQTFKSNNEIPRNGLITLKKNVTRFNQDAGLACDMTLESKTVNGAQACFGTLNESIELQHHDNLNRVDVDVVDMSVFDTPSNCDETQSDISDQLWLNNNGTTASAPIEI